MNPSFHMSHVLYKYNWGLIYATEIDVKTRFTGQNGARLYSVTKYALFECQQTEYCDNYVLHLGEVVH